MLDFLYPTGLTFASSLFVTFILGLTTFGLLLWNSVRKQSYWKKIGIPYVTPWPFIGSISREQKPFHEMELSRYNEFGRVYGHYEGNRPVLSVGEPELLRQILVKDFQSFSGRRIVDFGSDIGNKIVSTVRGEDWKRIRSIITPTFTTGKIKRMLNIFKECSSTVVQNFKKYAEKGEPVEVKGIYGAFVMDVIASTAFSTKIDSHSDPTNPFVQMSKDFFVKNPLWKILIFLICPGLMKFKWLKLNFFNPKSMEFFSSVSLQIIEERKRTGQTRNDFLQLLLDTAKEEDNKLDENEKDDIAENYGKDENEKSFKQNIYSKKTLSHDEIIAQCVGFFLGGYDTTASTLSFASYCLALNPDIQEILIQEIDGVMKENNGELDYEALQNMKYLDNVISETLRLYTPIIRSERMADENCKLGDTGLTIPKGMIVSIPVYAIHRDPELYPDPEKFDPDRFTPEERAKRNQYAYLPFGAGPRNCVAMRFALIEMKVCLAYVLSNFRIKKCPHTKVPLDYNEGTGLLQPKDITLELEVRKDGVTGLKELNKKNSKKSFSNMFNHF